MELLVKFLFLILTLLISSCSFNSSDENTETISEAQRAQRSSSDLQDLTIDELKALNTSGDMISDYDKLQMGLNPFVADIPDLRVRFLQNYKITVFWEFRHKETGDVTRTGDFVLIDTKTSLGDPDFQYRVGSILARHKAHQEAARVGRFSSHSWGELQETDLTRVKYPEIDPSLYLNALLKHGVAFEDTETRHERLHISNVVIELENTARLNPSRVYRSIRDLELNFYYYSYVRESWELLHTEKVERNFFSGQTETFVVKIEYAPINLIRDNFLRKGEFIISEVGNFQMPEKEDVDFKTLMNSVRQKSTQVILDTPTGLDRFFIASREGKARANFFLDQIMEKSHRIEEDQITKIGQFENNLSPYTYLDEIKREDKKGRWFVFTDKINRHYLDYEFLPSETVILSYLTGSELARQSEEKVNTSRYQVSGGDDFQIYPLGNISKNSRVSFQIKPLRRSGQKIKSFSDQIHSPGGSCGRNCISPQFTCSFTVALLENRSEEFKFDRDLKGELKNLSLIVNNDEFSLVDLIQEKKVSLQWVEDYLHLTIDQIDTIHDIHQADENVLALKVVTTRGSSFNGLKLTGMSGDDSYYCPMHISNIAGQNKWPISVESVGFGNWSPTVRWDLIQRGERITFKEIFSIGVSSTINNFYN